MRLILWYRPANSQFWFALAAGTETECSRERAARVSKQSFNGRWAILSEGQTPIGGTIWAPGKVRAK